MLSFRPPSRNPKNHEDSASPEPYFHQYHLQQNIFHSFFYRLRFLNVSSESEARQEYGMTIEVDNVLKVRFVCSYRFVVRNLFILLTFNFLIS